MGLQIPVLRQVDFAPAWRSCRLVIAVVMSAVVLASHPGWVTSVVQALAYDSATLTYDAPIVVASSRGGQQAPPAVPAVNSERTAAHASGAVPHLYDNPLDLVAPSGTAIRALDDVPFPDELAGGPSNVHVYFGVRDGKPVYVGITNDVGRRQAQHGDRFVLDPLTTDPVTRGQARVIEQALIERNPGFENAINSISPRHGYYQSAVDWGEAWLRANGY